MSDDGLIVVFLVIALGALLIAAGLLVPEDET